MIDIKELSEEKVGNRIRSAREDRDVEQKVLAEKIGVSPSTLNKIEKGRQAIRLEQLGQIANALDIKIGYLLGIDKDTNFVDDFIMLFDKLITSKYFYEGNPEVYSPDDLMYALDRDFIVLKGDPALFELIKKIAVICGQERNLYPTEYQSRLNAVKNRYKETKEKISEEKRSNAETFFLISGDQISEMVNMLLKSERAISTIEVEQTNTGDIGQRPPLCLRINKE